MKTLDIRTALSTLILSISAIAPAWATSEPRITSLEGTVQTGEEIVLRGTNFSIKTDARPLLFWSADGGAGPSPLSRKTSWDNRFNGDLRTKAQGAIVAAGSEKSARVDYSENSGAVLGRVDVETDQFYVWRKRYDDFDMVDDRAIRTRILQLTPLKAGATLREGMLSSSADRSVWGQVAQVTKNNEVFYSTKVGNYNDETLARSALPMGSVIYFYEKGDFNLTTPVLTAVNNEAAGVYHTFNHKILRIWANYGKNNSDSLHISLDGYGAFHGVSPKPFWRNTWRNRIEPATKRWAIEEFQYQTNTIDVQDGVMHFWQDRLPAWDSSERFIFRTSAQPLKHTEIFQTQVSNGTQPGAFEYFDSLYVDDSWHRVLICAEQTWAKCRYPEIMIPLEWSDETIKVNVRLGSLKELGLFYFYVVNGAGKVNSVGLRACPKCPTPPNI